MGHRDPGNKPGPGDRVNYAYIKNPDKKALQGEKIESPDYIKEANLKLDYGHYITNQIMKPLQQLFALELENISLFKEKWGPAKWQLEYLKLKEKWTDSEKLVKKYEEMRMKEIKALIFEAYADNRDDSIDPFARAITSAINAPVAKFEIAAVAEELFLTEIFLIID